MTHPPHPPKLIQAFARSNGVLLLGPERDLSTLAPALARECEYPPAKTDHTLPAVARYYQAMLGGDKTGRTQLVRRLREWLGENGTQPTPLHRAAARLPGRRFMDFSYDDLPGLSSR